MSPPRPQKSWIVKQLVYAGLLEELDRHFGAMGVRYMPIKGAYLISAGLAERIPAREMCDVDLLVEQRDFSSVKSYLAACEGYRLVEDPWEFEFRVYVPGPGGQELLVEVHHQLNRPERFHLPTEELFARASQKGDFLWLPAAEDALAIAVCHAVVHIGWGGFREDLFSDMEAITGLAGFRWERFSAVMAASGIMRFCRFVFLLYERRRGHQLFPDRLRATIPERLLIRLYLHRYGRLPVVLLRLLFELPFVAHPARLTLQACGGRGGV